MNKILFIIIALMLCSCKYEGVHYIVPEGSVITKEADDDGIEFKTKYGCFLLDTEVFEPEAKLPVKTTLTEINCVESL